MNTPRLDERRTRAAIAAFDLIETDVRPHLAAGGNLWTKGSGGYPSRLRQMLGALDDGHPVSFATKDAMELPQAERKVEHVIPFKRIIVEIVDPSQADPRSNTRQGPIAGGPATSPKQLLSIFGQLLVKCWVTKDEPGIWEGDPMTNTGARPEAATAPETVKYETKTVQTVRGTEKLMISKWERDGWELVTQNPGKLRTELVFRRPKPPLPWKLFAIVGGALVVVAIAIILGITLGGDKDDNTAPASTPSTEAVAPRDEPSTEPEEPDATAPADEPTLTVQNNADLAALLTGPQDGPTVEAFAQKYAGQLIEFDGAIGAMNPHEGYTSRYDIMIVSGDYSETHSNGGPSFQFRDVSITNDLHLTDDAPDTIGVGDNVHVIARVGSLDGQLFLLEPVRTSVR